MPTDPAQYPPFLHGGVSNSNLNWGVQAHGHDVNASQTNTYGQQPTPELATAQAALTEAIEALRTELASLRAQFPQAIPAGEAEYADAVLAELETDVTDPQPRPHALRRGIDAVTSTLGSIGQLAAGVAALRTAYEGFPLS
ncbi:DUF5955 family protein [Streptomyces fulvoviolaceus]|uniref:DUF5955 family protein n=1 Tax=Streptomyces fulvoviolaceus TaxID=285535 RepID=UPI0021BE78CA|nr:DUF5955 family protein [Streptomyces fulvoviolaceus]MCT9077535.1 DUF5955 family protein [Streptomyces fulvoviolaceus]